MNTMYWIIAGSMCCIGVIALLILGGYGQRGDLGTTLARMELELDELHDIIEGRIIPDSVSHYKNVAESFMRELSSHVNTKTDLVGLAYQDTMRLVHKEDVQIGKTNGFNENFERTMLKLRPVM